MSKAVKLLIARLWEILSPAAVPAGSYLLILQNQGIHPHMIVASLVIVHEFGIQRMGKKTGKIGRWYDRAEF